MSAIAATFVDMRPIGTRKVCRLVFEVPAEQADTALEILGYPRPDDPVWVGIARLVKPPSAEGSPPGSAERSHVADAGPPHSGVASAEPKTKRDWKDLPASTRAALLCKDDVFRVWLKQHTALGGAGPVSELIAAEIIRDRCGISSRAQLDTNPDALELFWQIETAYYKRNDPPVVPEHMR